MSMHDNNSIEQYTAGIDMFNNVIVWICLKEK